MTRTHRRWHVWTWPAVAALAAGGLLLAVWSRPPLPIEADAAANAKAEVRP
jgi:hypothetical protein